MPAADTLSDADAVAALRTVIARTPRRPDVWVRASENSGHVGGMLAECALQAGLNYETVVVPRVKAFVDKYPAASTVSGLRALLASSDTASLLGIRNARKCGVFRDLAHLLFTENVETPPDLRAWLEHRDSRNKLLALHGVAVKTAAYLRLLIGLPSVAIDVHLRRAAAEVGVRRPDDKLEQLYSEAAKQEGVPLAELDGSLWQRGADRSRTRRRST